ncbi:MAG: HAD family hydrolase [Pseudolysinimonas sp.]
MSRRQRTLLFDFDGTVSLGPGPVLAYATIAAEGLGAAESEPFVAAIAASLVAFPHGRVPGTGAIDGYDLVRIRAIARGIDERALGRAYLASRAQLATPLAPVHAPDGFADFLANVRGDANLLVATNAPATRLDEALEVLGLGRLFDAVYPSAGKPDGLVPIVDDWLVHGDVLSIGDIWANDLAPAQARGAHTALVGPDPDEADDATPDIHVPSMSQLYPFITEWLAGSPFLSTKFPHNN